MSEGLKGCLVPALCILGTLWVVKGCENERAHVHPRTYIPRQPAPVYETPVRQQPIQEQPAYYQEVYQESPIQTRVIRRRVIHKTIRTTTSPDYYYKP